mgnify:CR=1 FL=1
MAVAHCISAMRAVRGGLNFWAWGGEGIPGKTYTGDPAHEPQGLFSVFATDSTTSRLLQNIEEGIVFSREGDTIWVCRNCGHINPSSSASRAIRSYMSVHSKFSPSAASRRLDIVSPGVCPVCNHPQSFFEMEAVNY